MASIQGVVWNDLNNDALRQSGEPGLSGWTQLLDLNGNGVRDLETRSVTSSGSSVTIPDLGKRTMKMTVSGFVTRLTDVNVRLNINHSADNDLDVFLISPNGTRVELFTDVGGRSSNFTNTTLDDQASVAITAGSAPFSGSFRPERLLAALNGQNPNGVWKLEITDDARNRTGSLLNWSLTLTGQEEPVAVSSATGSYSFAGLPAGTFQVREVVQPGWVQTSPTGGAPHSVTLSTTQNVTGRDFGNRVNAGEIRGTVWNDQNGDGSRSSGEPGLSGRTVFLDLDNDAIWDSNSLSSASADVPKAISDLTTTTSTLPISGLFGPITDVDVTLTINHTYNEDLNTYLISPVGTRVALFAHVGGDSDNFSSTTLDDQAAASITVGSTPFTGRFRPASPLSVFNGQSANGTWTLEVVDDATNDTGSLVSWSLAIQSNSEPGTLTSATGEYAFTTLPPRTYHVREVVPETEVRTFPTGDGGHTVEIVAGQVAVGNDFGSRLRPTTGEIRGMAWSDLNGDGVRNSGEPGLAQRQMFLDTNNNGNHDVATLSLPSGDVPRPVNDLSTTTSTLTVAGFDGPISDVNVTLSIQHTYDEDLSGFLISPTGTRVRLFSGVGGEEDNFENTTFDDEAIPAIATGTAPFHFSFRPDSPLSAFDGQTANGTWRLEISDTVANDVGSLLSWSLSISGDGEPLAITDSSGAYAFTSLAPGSYTPRQILPPFWVQTFPAGLPAALQLNLGDVVSNIHFGSQNTQPNQPLLPDIFVWASQPRGYMYGDTIQNSSGRRLLRFDTAIANLGQGPLEIRGSTTHPDGTQDVLQRIYDTEGGFSDRLAGTFVFHPEHGHIHFNGYAQYSLRSITPGGGVGGVVASGGKVSFCLLDVAKFDQPVAGSPSSPRYVSCTDFQGISVGWADVYDKSLPDQWVDITDVPPGTYWLEIAADPDNQLLETDETNNIARIQVEVPSAGSALLLDPPTSSLRTSLAPAPAAALTGRDLMPILTAALARLTMSSGIAHTAALADVKVHIADLPGNQLGYAQGRTMWIDVDAAGYGWFVDQTPYDDREFLKRVAARGLGATTTSPAYNRSDLLTVVMHEMGHLLGHEHGDLGSIMEETLPLGTRRLLDDATERVFSGWGRRGRDRS